jgi:hypothetical protein
MVNLQLAQHLVYMAGTDKPLETGVLFMPSIY